MLIKTIKGVPIILDDDNVIRFTADADIDSDGGPNVDNDPYWQPDTTLHHNGLPINAQTVPFAVIPIGVLNKVKGLGLGCKVIVTNALNGRSAVGVLADLGPTFKVGEISPAMARLIGVNPDSVRGGESRNVIRYEVFLDVPAVVNGVTYKLKRL